LALTTCGAVVVGLLMAGSGHALTASRTTYLSFSGPVSLPGMTLPGGTYIFERALPEWNIHLVRISSADQKTVYLTTFTQLVDRPAALPANRHVTLGEAAAGMAPPIKAWFPIGDRQGHEFLYNAR
jgi:hypothetical protein